MYSVGNRVNKKEERKGGGEERRKGRREGEKTNTCKNDFGIGTKCKINFSIS